MKIFPAIDLLGGRAVRLINGDFSTAKTYSDDPVAQAALFARGGAEYLHIVDLDGARSGRTENGALIREILKCVDIKVEVGGGIRDEKRIEYYLSAGVDKVILGTAAVRNPDFLARAINNYGERIAVGADVKEGYVAVDGWTGVSEYTGYDFISVMADSGVKTVIYTDVSRDGTMSGVDTDFYRELTKISGVDIVASGGIGSKDEISALADAGVYGAIVGKALYEGRLSLAECLTAAGGKNDN